VKWYVDIYHAKVLADSPVNVLTYSIVLQLINILLGHSKAHGWPKALRVERPPGLKLTTNVLCASTVPSHGSGCAKTAGLVGS
jgi:hypothetical protein